MIDPREELSVALSAGVAGLTAGEVCDQALGTLRAKKAQHFTSGDRLFLFIAWFFHQSGLIVRFNYCSKSPLGCFPLVQVADHHAHPLLSRSHWWCLALHPSPTMASVALKSP